MPSLPLSSSLCLTRQHPSALFRSALVALILVISGSMGCASTASEGTPEAPEGEPSVEPAAEPDGGVAEPADGGLNGEPDAAVIVGGDRPVEVYVPSGYDAATPAPLVLMFHGYGFTGAYYESQLQLTAEAEARGFLYAVPEGTIDANNAPFWNASPTCCDFARSGVDDSAYLRSLIDEISGRMNVDPKRIYVLGHSNGGFMSYRMACDHADVVAAFISISGAYVGDALCSPSEPVSALQVHGTSDTTIQFEGGALAPGLTYPGAQSSIESWATLNGCALEATTEETPRDYDSQVAGDETTVTRYATECEQQSEAELWTLDGAGHIIYGTPALITNLVDFLYAHPKP